MFSNKDIEFKSIFVINCLEKKSLKVKNGELYLEDGENNKALTKFPFQKILAIFVIGNISITSPLIEKCRRYGIFVAVMKFNLRPVFTFGAAAEGNFLLRERQHRHDVNDMDIPRFIVKNKMINQRQLLLNTRLKDNRTTSAIESCEVALQLIDEAKSLNDMMGLEGWVAKAFFEAYYQSLGWKQRQPRIKSDEINVTLDMGYTILFNFMETFLNMFGFDVYVGVYHRLWFKRKSLVCDLIEPFRCIIDQQVRKAYNLGQFKKEHFKTSKNEYFLQREHCLDYYKVFFTALIDHKNDFFLFVQSYYRMFMKGAPASQFKMFELKKTTS